MTGSKRVADFYVVLEARGSFNKAAVVGVRQTRPTTNGRQIAVRVRLTLPPDAFTTWTPLVEAEVDPRLLVPPTVDVVEPAPEPESTEGES